MADSIPAGRSKRAEMILERTVYYFKELRQKKKLSHETVAKKAGISRPALSHIESSKRKPSLMVALRLSKALEVNLSEVLKKAEKDISVQ